MNAPARGALMRLEGKTAMIAGAAGPMGEAVARRFVEEGAAVLLFDTSGRRLDEVASRLERRDRVITHRGDSLVEGDVQAAVAASLSAFEQRDILVNIVGGIVCHRIATPQLELSDMQLSATLELNLRSVLLTARCVVPHMQRQSYGRIVNLGSVSVAGEAGQAEYSAAKAGVAAMTRVMAIEFAPDITANCIAPALSARGCSIALISQWSNNIEIAHCCAGSASRRT